MKRKGESMPIKILSKETKNQLRELEGQKVILEDALEFETRPVQMVRIEEEIYEIEDTIRKLTAENKGK